MADTSAARPPLLRRLRPDGAWGTIAAILATLAVVDPGALWPTVRFAGDAYLGTLPFLAFAVIAVGYLKAAGAEALLARAFEGRPLRMIVMAALLGGLSPFCSCQVIPFIAALLAVGAPLGAVMAFWLSSPLMDPAMFTITAATLGLDFALAKAVAAVGLGLFGGLIVRSMQHSVLFADPLRTAPRTGACCGPRTPFRGQPHWRFWSEPARRATFRETTLSNALFLTKWLLLAYVLESLMLAYLPAQWIGGLVGGTGPAPVILGALVGAPAYLNGYAAVPLIDGLLAQGMAPGAAMSFVIAGGVSCIPAAVAVWALVRPRVFAAYIGLAMTGAVIAGFAWGALA